MSKFIPSVILVLLLTIASYNVEGDAVTTGVSQRKDIDLPIPPNSIGIAYSNLSTQLKTLIDTQVKAEAYIDDLNIYTTTEGLDGIKAFYEDRMFNGGWEAIQEIPRLGDERFLLLFFSKGERVAQIKAVKSKTSESKTIVYTLVVEKDLYRYLPHLIAAYTIIWVGLFCYVFSLVWRQRRVNREIESLKKSLHR